MEELNIDDNDEMSCFAELIACIPHLLYINIRSLCSEL